MANKQALLVQYRYIYFKIHGDLIFPNTQISMPMSVTILNRDELAQLPYRGV